MTARSHPLACIVPPYILKEIIEKGTPEQRDWAVKTLRVTSQMTEQRKGLTEGDRPMITGAPSAITPPLPNRVVYNARNSGTLPGTVVRSEGDNAVADDPAVNEAYDGAGFTFDLFQQVYNRNSINNQGMRIDSTVHYLNSYDNAFWNGEQMVYGDGDEDFTVPAKRIFNRFTISVDVIGHELTHGVTQYEANLNYQGQSGALNESFSDVFGMLVKQRRDNLTAAQSNWIIGQGLFTSNVNAVGIRSMKEPGTAYNDPLIGKDPQPGHMRDYVNTLDDNGGVHYNSGIPNRAFYLAAVEMGGYAWEKAGLIWYAALTGNLLSNASFQTAADMTWSLAGSMYGANSLEQMAVLHGWAGVGIDVNTGNPPPQPPQEPAGCFNALLGFLGLQKKAG